MKEENTHNYPFDADIFRRTFNGYVQKFNTTLTIAIILICSPFIVYGIAWYLETAKVHLPSFLGTWYATGTLFFDRHYKLLSLDLISIGNFSVGLVSAGIQFSFGLISIGGTVSCGLVSFGGMSSFGLISIGGFLSCGLISIGGRSSVGVIALGHGNVYGIVAIAMGMEKPFEKNQYIYGKAFGFIAIGRHAQGVYTLSYHDGSEGTYQLSPKRQDPEAVVLFTQWFRKFKNVFVEPTQS